MGQYIEETAQNRGMADYPTDFWLERKKLDSYHTLGPQINPIWNKGINFKMRTLNIGRKHWELYGPTVRKNFLNKVTTDHTLKEMIYRFDIKI